MSWLQCSKKRQAQFSAAFPKKLSMTCTKETLAGGVIILATLLGVFMVFCWGQGSDKDIRDNPRGNFLQRATTPAFSTIYQVKRVERNGKELAYVMKKGEKGNLNSNKNHPTKIPLSMSPQN